MCLFSLMHILFIIYIKTSNYRRKGLSNMATLYCTLASLILLTCSVLSETLNDSKPDIDIITVSKLPECEKSLQYLDVGIFDVDMWYQLGDRTENSLPKGEEKTPFTVQLGKKKILKSVEKAITGMCVGEHRKITVPPHLAYGNKTITFTDGREELRGGVTIISDIKLLQIIRNTEDEKRKIFRLIDTDGNEEIGQDEIQAMVDLYSTVLHRGTSGETKQIMSDMFKGLDKNEDGIITLDEFGDSNPPKVSKLSETKLVNGLLKNLMKATTDQPEQCPVCPAAEPEHCPDLEPCPNKPTKSNKMEEMSKQSEGMGTTTQNKDFEETSVEYKNVKDEL